MKRRASLDFLFIFPCVFAFLMVIIVPSTTIERVLTGVFILCGMNVPFPKQSNVRFVRGCRSTRDPVSSTRATTCVWVYRPTGTNSGW